MSRRGGPGLDLSEQFQDFLHSCAKVLCWLGTLASVVALAFLVFTCYHLSGSSSAADLTAAATNVDIFQKVLMAGLIGVGVGTSYLFWGEDILGAIQLIIAGALFFAPLYLPDILGNNNTNKGISAALDAIKNGGVALGSIGLVVLIVDLGGRMRQRIKTGVKADQLKYGKGIKEETDRQNVFLGKCWQLPFCRKFVRERCPIYHSKRTCWNEKVGCMCEEEVIRNAMENKPIPKDALLAGRMIPKNHRLSLEAKKERCRTCVIYNEHQKHKYKASLPAILLSFLVFYLAFHGLLYEAAEGMVHKINKVLQGVTYNAVGQAPIPPLFIEMLLVVFMIIGLAYTLKIAEYLIFKLKI